MPVGAELGQLRAGLSSSVDSAGLFWAEGDRMTSMAITMRGRISVKMRVVVWFRSSRLELLDRETMR